MRTFITLNGRDFPFHQYLDVNTGEIYTMGELYMLKISVWKIIFFESNKENMADILPIIINQNEFIKIIYI